MKILQTTDSYPPPLVGGRDLQTQLLSHELVARGHTVEVACLAGSAGAVTEWDGPVRVHRLEGWARVLRGLYVDPDKPFHPTLPDPGMMRQLRSLIAAFRPDVVHAHSWLLYSLLPLLPTRDTRLVVAISEYGFVCPKNTFVYKGGVCTGPSYFKCIPCASQQYGLGRALALTTGQRAMRPWTGRVDRYVANSRATAAASSRLPGRRGASIRIITPFVPDAVFGRGGVERPAFVPPTGDYIMFAGGMGPHKGITVLLEAWPRVVPAPPLVLAGVRRPDTPEHFPAGVIVAEQVPHREVLAGWRHALAAVVPSLWPEPFGTVAVEAMATGTPVIASDVGGLADIVEDGVTGFLVPPGDVGTLASRLQRLVEDPELRLRMGVAATHRARRYAASSVVPQWEQLYQEVTTGNIAGPRLARSSTDASGS